MRKSVDDEEEVLDCIARSAPVDASCGDTASGIARRRMAANTIVIVIVIVDARRVPCFFSAIIAAI